MFQTLDDKGECVGIYRDGELYFDNIPEDLDKTWNYVSFLEGQDIEYASIYALGKSLDEVCPPELKLQWDNINKKLKSLVSSFVEAQVSLKDNCFYDLVPKRFLKEYCEVKNKICQRVFQTHERPKEYEFYKEFTEFISDVSSRNLQVDRTRLSQLLYLPQGKKLWEKVNNGNTSIKYNLFNSVTGRLTVTDRSFPILTLNSKFREVIKPQNDWFVALDLNAAEMRIALALADQEQIADDLHEQVRNEVFGGDVTRAQAKNISTQWLYDARNEEVLKYDHKLSNFYNKEKLFSDYWKGGFVHTPYSRKIEADAHKVISYLCQSTLIDMFHRQLIKVWRMLDGYGTFISFMVHDCVVFDLKESEKSLLPEIIRTISDTPYGTFPAKVEIGKDFYNMKKVNIKV